MLLTPELSFQKFADNCAASGVGLDPGLTDDPISCDVGSCYQPDDWYGAVAKAGNMLREAPQLELVDAPTTDELFGDDPLTVSQMTFKGIVNASRNRVAGENLATTFFCRGAKRFDSCSSAEGYFGVALNNMVNARSARRSTQLKDWHTKLGWTIITDNNTPIGITKKGGERSTLALSPITINGIPYPAGSLLRMNTLKEVSPRRYEEPYLEEERRSVVPGESIAFASFLRLSAFALPVQERGTFRYAINNAPDDESRQIVRTWTIEKIREIATQAMVYSWPAG